eukprot:scaffold58945_cov37-Tisochrysis_lutea.AAC.3
MALRDETDCWEMEGSGRRLGSVPHAFSNRECRMLDRHLVLLANRKDDRIDGLVGAHHLQWDAAHKLKRILGIGAGWPWHAQTQARIERGDPCLRAYPNHERTQVLVEDELT